MMCSTPKVQAPPPAPPPPAPAPTPVQSTVNEGDENARRKAMEEMRKKRGMASTILGGKTTQGTILGLAQMNDAMKKQLGE